MDRIVVMGRQMDERYIMLHCWESVVVPRSGACGGATAGSPWQEKSDDGRRSKDRQSAARIVGVRDRRSWG